MALSENEGLMITRQSAHTLVSAYENSPNFIANNSVSGIFFGKNNIQTLLSQPGCVGIRIYYGKEGSSIGNQPHLVLIGADRSGNDIHTHILDAGLPCPHVCSINKL